MEVANLLYVVNSQCLAVRTGAESVFSNEGLITISFHDEASTERGFSNITRVRGVKIGNRQIRINIEMMGDDWKEGLKRLFEELASVKAGT